MTFKQNAALLLNLLVVSEDCWMLEALQLLLVVLPWLSQKADIAMSRVLQTTAAGMEK